MKVTEQNFDELMNSGKPVMIDFGATWCGPCKALAPRVEEIAAEYEGKAIVGTADVDECSDLAARFRIRNVPTVLFFKNGRFFFGIFCLFSLNFNDRLVFCDSFFFSVKRSDTDRIYQKTEQDKQDTDSLFHRLVSLYTKTSYIRNKIALYKLYTTYIL